MKAIQLGIKRFFDITISLVVILLLVVIPVLIIVPVVIRLTSKGRALFTQKRVGKNGSVFEIYKFRTMLIPKQRILPDGTELEPNDSITKVGAFLRKTSLDELPQLFNILKGDMSIVGPRPMIPSQVAKISEYHKTRHIMRPGVTGLAQVNGRNDLSWDEKLAYDMEYVEHFNLRLDISILFKTIRVIWHQEGIDYIHTMDKQ